MTALRAFVCVARHRSFSRAAEELHTSQPSVSRSIAELERRLSVRLLDRSPRNVRLTEAGSVYFRAVSEGLDRIGVGALAAAHRSFDDRLVIACTYEIAHLFLLPRFPALREVIGKDTSIRILTCDSEILGRLNATDADLVLSCQVAANDPQDCVVVFREAMAPVCASSYATEYAETLSRPVEEWGTLTFLDLTNPNQTWSRWEDWFAIRGAPSQSPRYVGFDNYVYLLEASSAGCGIAIGWRHLVDRYIEKGDLVRLSDKFVECGRPYYAMLSERSRGRAVARRCLDFLGNVGGDEERGGPTAVPGE